MSNENANASAPVITIATTSPHQNESIPMSPMRVAHADV